MARLIPLLTVGLLCLCFVSAIDNKLRRLRAPENVEKRSHEALLSQFKEVSEKIIHTPEYQSGLAYFWKYTDKSKIPFYLLHCRGAEEITCKSGHLAGSEYIEGPVTDSQRSDIVKGIGSFLFTRLVINSAGDNAKYQTISYSLEAGKAKSCFLIHPRVLLTNPFYAYKGDSGKTGSAPIYGNPILVDTPTLSLKSYVKNNVCVMKEILEKTRILNEVVILGPVPMSDVLAIDTSRSKDTFPKSCVGDNRKITYDMDQYHRISEVKPDFSAFEELYTKLEENIKTMFKKTTCEKALQSVTGALTLPSVPTAKKTTTGDTKSSPKLPQLAPTQQPPTDDKVKSAPPAQDHLPPLTRKSTV